MALVVRPRQFSRVGARSVAPLAAALKAPRLATRSGRQNTVQTCAFFGFGGTKFDDSKLYICVDCGYIYDGPQKISTVPDSYKCPVCQSPKKRFKAYTGPGGRPKNDSKSMTARLKAKQWK